MMKEPEKLCVSCVLPAAPERIWTLLSRVDSLRFVTSPLLRFVSLDTVHPEVFVQGGVYRFALRLFGVIPLGRHQIHIKLLDPVRCCIRSEETGRMAPLWHHRITLKALPGGQTYYTDSLSIDAGWRTGMVCLFARLFYRHRQKRWARLLARN